MLVNSLFCEWKKILGQIKNFPYFVVIHVCSARSCPTSCLRSCHSPVESLLSCSCCYPVLIISLYLSFSCLCPCSCPCRIPCHCLCPSPCNLTSPDMLQASLFSCLHMVLLPKFPVTPSFFYLCSYPVTSHIQGSLPLCNIVLYLYLYS